MVLMTTDGSFQVDLSYFTSQLGEIYSLIVYFLRTLGACVQSKSSSVAFTDEASITLSIWK